MNRADIQRSSFAVNSEYCKETKVKSLFYRVSLVSEHRVIVSVFLLDKEYFLIMQPPEECVFKGWRRVGWCPFVLYSELKVAESFKHYVQMSHKESLIY